MNLLIEKLSKDVGKILKIIMESAPFALLLSIAFFWYETNNNNKEFNQTIDNLQKIEQSLTTRHIGIFPAYLDQINSLLSEETTHPTKIIIFEDVLFYGAFYNGTAFKKMIQQLTILSSNGNRIVIAYYDNNKDWLKGKMFREVVQESWMNQSDLKKLAQERDIIVDSSRNPNSNRRENFLNLLRADSIVSEKYFAVYRDDKQKDFSERRSKILQTPFYDGTKNDDPLFKRIDKIKNKCFDKPENNITFNDISTMYNQVTEELKAFFDQHNITTISLNNYLTMSCWSNGEKVLFAFPGRFAADEIGFISQDAAILRYINTMLDGVMNTDSLDEKSNEKDNY